MEENLQELRKQEKETFKKFEEKFPEHLQRPALPAPQDILPLIGITNIPANPAGFIRFHPEDFIVEEVANDNLVCTIEPETPTLQSDKGLKQKTLYANLVKIGIGTLEARQDLAHVLNLNLEQISYAGLKDSRALTSQRIGIRGLASLPALPKKQYFLNPQTIGKGALAPGQLQGNRFTITVRTNQPVDYSELQTKTQVLQENGYPNFYGVQRFGNRLLNPLLGKLLCQGNSEEALKTFICQSGPYDLPIISIIRQKAARHWGDWQKMYNTFNILPYAFRHERKALQSLLSEPNQWEKAITTISDQATFWMYGYVSFLVNKMLSGAYAGKIDIPDPLPLPLGNNTTDVLYKTFLEQDQTDDYLQYLPRYRFFIRKPRTIKPWIFPSVHNVYAYENFSLLSFSLPKAAYATTFLMFLFDIYEGTPVPPWVTVEKIDAKATLGIGSVVSALEQLDTSLITTVLPDKKME